MSDVLPLISVEAADEIAAAQIHVLQLMAKHTETTIDDQALAFLQANGDARKWFFELLGLESGNAAGMSVSDVPVGIMSAAQAAGISWLEIVNLLVKYGPQLRQLFAILRELIEVFKGLKPSTPGEPSGEPTDRPEFG